MLFVVRKGRSLETDIGHHYDACCGAAKKSRIALERICSDRRDSGPEALHFALIHAGNSLGSPSTTRLNSALPQIWRYIRSLFRPYSAQALPSLIRLDYQSGTSSASWSDLTLMSQFDTANRLFSTVGLTLLYYNFATTVDLEVERYWSGSRSWASVFFFINRYTAVLAHIPVVYEFFGLMPESLQTFHQIYIVLGQGIVAICLLLRTHALCMRDRRVLYVSGGMFMIAFAVCVWTITSVHLSQEPVPQDMIAQPGCDLTVSINQAIFLAVAWGVMLVLDATVFTITFFQAIHMDRLWSHSLAHRMLIDGALYFGVLAVFYLSDIVTYVVAPIAYKGVLTTLTNILSNVLVSRMMLNIRDPNLFELPRHWPEELGRLSAPEPR